MEAGERLEKETRKSDMHPFKMRYVSESVISIDIGPPHTKEVIIIWSDDDIAGINVARPIWPFLTFRYARPLMKRAVSLDIWLSKAKQEWRGRKWWSSWRDKNARHAGKKENSRRLILFQMPCPVFHWSRKLAVKRSGSIAVSLKKEGQRRFCTWNPLEGEILCLFLSFQILVSSSPFRNEYFGLFSLRNFQFWQIFRAVESGRNGSLICLISDSFFFRLWQPWERFFLLLQRHSSYSFLCLLQFSFFFCFFSAQHWWEWIRQNGRRKEKKREKKGLLINLGRKKEGEGDLEKLKKTDLFCAIVASI